MAKDQVVVGGSKSGAAVVDGSVEAKRTSTVGCPTRSTNKKGVMWGPISSWFPQKGKPD